jgi:hypothetical protein
VSGVGGVCPILVSGGWGDVGLIVG